MTAEKFQIPSFKFQRNPKFKAPNTPADANPNWSLELLWNLELGIWNFFRPMRDIVVEN
jgi:hypothetical protein